MDMKLKRMGVVRSPLADRAEAPKQGREGAPQAVIEIDQAYADCMSDLQPGSTVLLFTWLHKADRSYQRVHPRGDTARPKRGIFSTRSPDRPNPIGLHEVRIIAVEGTSLTVEPLEAIDGTPVVDIKPIIF